MLARLPAVVQDVGVIAAGVFEGVGEGGETVESPVVLDCLGQLADGEGEPRWVHGEVGRRNLVFEFFPQSLLHRARRPSRAFNVNP
jgi:hypothetical protein